MALFRRNREKAPSAAEPAARQDEPPASIAGTGGPDGATIAQLAQTPEVGHFARLGDQAAVNRRHMVSRHLEAIHRPGGLAAIKQEADFMDLGGRRTYLDGLSETEITVEHQVVSGNSVATLWSVSGVHSAELFGIPPSSERVTINGVTLSVIREGLITTEYSYWDFPPLMQRLTGAQPPQS